MSPLRLNTGQDYFFSVSQQDIDRFKASIRKQTTPLHRRQPIPDAISIVRIAEEAIIIAQQSIQSRPEAPPIFVLGLTWLSDGLSCDVSMEQQV
jgi:hypothetical protein